MSNIRKRKKMKVIRHILHDDCRACMKKHFSEQPLVKEIGSISCFKESYLHLYHTKNTLPYLLQMTELSGKEIVRIFAESGNVELSRTMGEYFGDIEQILRMVINIRGYE